MDHLLHFAKRKSYSERSVSVGKENNKLSKGATVEIDIKSPPLIFYGTTEFSTGALLSGELHLIVTDPDVKLQKYTMQLLAKVTTKKPVTKDCRNCATKTNEIFTWEFVKEPTDYNKEKHTLPFSYLLKGHLTATTHNKLGSIEYILEATAQTSTGETIKDTRMLDVKRALQPGSERSSPRIFPPTNLKTEVTFPPVVHPIGEFNVAFRLTGITWNTESAHFRWHLRRLTWRIEEVSKIISPACHKHAAKVGGEGKGVQHNDVRTIGDKDIVEGWKTDWTDGGTTELEFTSAIKPTSSPTCDMESPTGFKVTHRLSMELVVGEEVAPAKRPNSWSATGTARVLRTQHALVVTERSGMGISWDEEQPPMYEDVPKSPPGYIKMDECNDIEDPLRRLDLGGRLDLGESREYNVNLPSIAGGRPGSVRFDSPGEGPSGSRPTSSGERPSGMRSASPRDGPST